MADGLMIPRPQTDEYFHYYGNYINRVPEGSDVLAILGSQLDELKTLLHNIDDERACARPAPGEWSIKEVVGHMTDTERIFAYRALRFARNDTVSLPGFDQDEFVKGTDFNRRTLADLLDEFDYQRRANILLFRSLTDEETARRGTASGNPVSARALIYIMAGHVNHHVESLKTDYGVGG